MEILKVALTSVFSAVTLFIIAKIIGHKQMSQLDFFDYITGITIGSIAAELATEIEEPLKPFVAMIVYGAITFILSVATRKMSRIRKFVNGTPTIIMNNGKIYRKNLKKAKLDLSEFMVMCRQEGYFNLNDIQTAIFEYNGRLTVLPVSTKRPVNPADMELEPQPEHIFTEIIMDGRVIDENLKRMNLNDEWLKKQLKKQGLKSAKGVILGLGDDRQQVSVYKFE